MDQSENRLDKNLINESLAVLKELEDRQCRCQCLVAIRIQNSFQILNQQVSFN